MYFFFYKALLILFNIFYNSNCITRQMFATNSKIQDKISGNFVMYIVKSRSVTSCLQRCTETRGCASFFYHKQKSLCQLHSLQLSTYSTFNGEPGWRYYFAYLAACPTHQGYVYDDLLNVCVKPYRDQRSHNSAVARCRNQEAMLVKIDSATKRQFIKRLLAKSIYAGGFHIQGTKVRGVWRFDNGEPLRAVEWSSGQPQPGNYETCLMIYKPHNFQVHDAPATGANYGYICEKNVKKQNHNSIYK